MRRLVGEGDEALDQPTAAKPVAKPEPAPAPQPPVDPVAVDAKPPPLASIDDLMFAAARLREARGGEKLLQPTSDDDDRTQFYKRSDDFRQHESDQIHCLLKLDGEVPETRFVVSAEGLKVGRTAPADIIVAGAGVSRSHCLVELAGDQLRVSDLNSTNGTYIDNQRIVGAQDLPVGAVLRVGNVSFEHEIRSRAEIDQQSSAISGNRGNPREPKLARSS
ncbi:FHA domain-containing protein [Sphingomonas sp.]|uniref:FHA domain-containing protein n=1 Tax=Sphingomonas sp. TaxID=28214 RepID=UPI00286A022F|nr:FHA domain-containing protein [Sphingomonas sp.]